MKFYTALVLAAPALLSAQSSAATTVAASSRMEAAARAIIDAVPNPTFITNDAAGRPQSRTIAPLLPDSTWTVWFATNPRTRKVADIAKQPAVVLHYFDPVSESYVSLVGRARTARNAQNAAIAAGDLDAVSAFWTEDISVRRALGAPVSGRAAARAAFEPPVGAAAQSPRLVYRRVPTSIEVSTQWPLAFERGVWEGHEGSAAGPVLIGGKFSAQWVKRDGRWLIRSDVFVALTCAGAGCALIAVS